MAIKRKSLAIRFDYSAFMKNHFREEEKINFRYIAEFRVTWSNEFTSC